MIIFFYHIIALNFPRILESRYLWRWITKKKKKEILFFYFLTFFFFLNKECYLWVLTFWYLRNLKTLIIHISRNVLSFRKHKVLCMYLSVFIDNMMKTLKIYVFGNFILFLHKRCFACVLAFWYVMSSKTLKSKFLIKVVFIPM